MSEAAQSPDRLQLPAARMPQRRPNGVTAKQWRLAAIYPRAESAYQALIQAGYAKTTAAKQSSIILDGIGVKRATETLQARQLDSARGFMGLSRRALEKGEKQLDSLSPEDQLGLSLKAAELASKLGENLEQVGDSNSWRARLRRAIRLAYRFGYNKGREPLPIVLSPPENELSTE
jgi:hypothetical protein